MTDTVTASKSAPRPDPDPDRTLTVTRRLAAPREAVFRAWTDPAALAQWWGPEGWTAPLCQTDPRPGGAWRTCMKGPEGRENYVGGVYREVVVPERLVFTWAWETDGVPGQETVVTLEFHDRDGGTELVLTHGAFETVDSRDAHTKGWGGCLDCLARHLAATKP